MIRTIWISSVFSTSLIDQRIKFSNLKLNVCLWFVSSEVWIGGSDFENIASQWFFGFGLCVQIFFRARNVEFIQLGATKAH